MANEPVREPASEPTPARRLWRRYLRARGAKTGLCMICLFVLAAFLAPFAAHRLPFLWLDGGTGAASYPLIREFFAPSDTTEPFLEKGLNFLFLFIPLALLALAAIDRFLPGLAGRESKAVSLLFGALISLALWQGLGGMLADGGGADWFYRETRILPESEDVLDPGALLASPAGDAAGRRTAREAVLDALAGQGAAVPPHGAGEPSAWTETRPEEIAARLRTVIEGKAVAPVGILAEPGGIDARGISYKNLARGANLPRWNRLVVEYAFPGLLRPFVEFRTAFIGLAAATLLVLAGLTCIIMTAANQFPISPRWLPILILAGLVALPFGGTPRNDHTPYRELAAAGKGRGLFPPIPYGPNEQGFGPRLPPDWAVPRPGVTAAGIPDPERLARLLAAEPSDPAGAHAGRALARALAPIRAEPGAASREEWARALNQVIDDPGFFDPAAFAGIRRDFSLQPYFQALGAGKRLDGLDARRFNRLLLERALPDALPPVQASRWKKPLHLRGRHFLGTDESGRDVLTRLLHGARVSLSVGFVSVALATAIGLVMGSLAAYYGGRIDAAISRFMELMMCFPSFFLILAVIAVLDRRSILNIMLIIGLTSWTGVARLVRGEMLKHKKMEYVLASIALGASDARTIFRHILPNAMAPVLVSISFGITGAILTEASLSFIGFGVTPPTPTWGQLLSETRESPLANWWLAVFPGIVLFFGVLAYNLAGEALRDALDPRSN